MEALSINCRVRMSMRRQNKGQFHKWWSVVAPAVVPTNSTGGFFCTNGLKHALYILKHTALQVAAYGTVEQHCLGVKLEVNGHAHATLLPSLSLQVQRPTRTMLRLL